MRSFIDHRSPPPPLSTADRRDPKVYDNAAISKFANSSRAEDDATEHRYEELGNTYNTQSISYYDFIGLGFESTAEKLSRQIPSDFAVSAYLDLGTGTGLTAKACMGRLQQLKGQTKVVVIDALEGMLAQARKKLESMLNVASYIGDITGLPPAILQDIQNRWGISTFSLVTAQRVLLNVRKDRRAEVLQHWKSHLSEGGKLVVDIPHPGRAVGAIVIGYMAEAGSNQPNQDSRPVWTMCCRLADDRVWDECRSYARDLARDAGLMITNNMPKALPEWEIGQDGRPAFQSWLASRRPTTLTDPLTRTQLTWFNHRYTEDAIAYYRRLGLQANPEIAGVLVVLEHPLASSSLAPTSSGPGSQAHTKYVIDETLHGKARINAKKNASKKEKKKAAKEEKEKAEGP